MVWLWRPKGHPSRLGTRISGRRSGIDPRRSVLPVRRRWTVAYIGSCLTTTKATLLGVVAVQVIQVHGLECLGRRHSVPATLPDSGEARRCVRCRVAAIGHMLRSRGHARKHYEHQRRACGKRHRTWDGVAPCAPKAATSIRGILCHAREPFLEAIAYRVCLATAAMCHPVPCCGLVLC